LFMTPIGWKLAGIVWAYALVWALVTDRVKLLGYRILDPTKASLLAKKPSVDITHVIAARAYELYQQRVQGESQQDQDWLEAERETLAAAAARKKIA
jgi:H+-transporting ATPase